MLVWFVGVVMSIVWSCVCCILCVWFDSIGDVLMMMFVLCVLKEGGYDCWLMLLMLCMGVVFVKYLLMVDDVWFYDVLWVKYLDMWGDLVVDFDMIDWLFVGCFDVVVIFIVYS